MVGMRKSVLFVLFGMVLLVAGCAGAPSLAVTTPVPDLPTALPAAPTAGADNTAQVLTNADSGKAVTLKVGQVLSVQLRDRQWNPPTVDESILQPQVLNVAVPAGVSRWDYKAVAPGTVTLTTEGACLPSPSGVSCNSIILYKVTITVTS